MVIGSINLVDGNGKYATIGLVLGLKATPKNDRAK